MSGEPTQIAPSSLWHAIGRQLQTPAGIGGRLIGLAMRLANAAPNERAIDALALEPGDHVLELGFSPGHALQMMETRLKAGKLYGVDQSPVMHAQARRRNMTAIRQGRIMLYGSPFDLLPLKDRSVSKVLAVNVIYFWRDVPAVLGEVHRVLRPNGRAVIYATDAATMSSWKFTSADTHQLYDASHLTAALRQGPFRESRIEVEEVRFWGRIRGLVATLHRNEA